MPGRVYARLYRPTYTQKVPAHATFLTIKGKRSARWTQRGGRIVTAPLVPAAPERCTVQVDRWWVEYRDHRGDIKREPAFRDRTASEKKKLDIVTRVERQAAGLPVPVVTTFAESMSELLEKWERSIVDAGRSAAHAKLYRRRARDLFDAIGAHRPADIAAAAVEATLGTWRREGKVGVQTSNHYLTAARAFCRWCIPKYLDHDPLAGIGQLNADLARTFERRALTPEEFERLLAATAARPTRSPIAGPDRAMAYLVTAYTGARLGELAKLTAASFRLNESPPVVQLPASKGKPPVVQVIPEQIVERLRIYLRGKPPTRPLWRTSAWVNRKATRTLRLDLAAAEIPFKDDTGRIFNFHALRTQFATWLAQANVPIQHAQKLLRHSDPRLTIKFYTRLGAKDLADELRKLPAPPK